MLSTYFLNLRSFEHEINLPYDSRLSISIKDDSVIGGELIGTTKIDLEDRYYSKCYAVCGISEKYEKSGYNAWRDQLLPSEILKKMCKKLHLRPPKFQDNYIVVYTIDEYENIYTVDTSVEEKNTQNFAKKDLDLDSKFLIRENLALRALKDWKDISLVRIFLFNFKFSQNKFDFKACPLVTEHVETRSLYNHKNYPGMIRGNLELWIDLFPVEEADNRKSQIPKIVDITPAKPIEFELRVIIRNTSDVVLDDDGLISGEKSSDIYVKGFITNENESQRTDVHNRSMNGEGSC